MDLVAEADGAVSLKVSRDPSAPDLQVRPLSLGTRALEREQAGPWA